MNFPTVYLASSSPRRRELLTQIGVDFSVLPVDVDESQIPGEDPKDYVERIAIAKSVAGWQSLDDGSKKPVLGADTSVILSDRILGKPADRTDARHMLLQLSGKTHRVMTAVAITDHTGSRCLTNISSVTFCDLSESDIDWYLDTGEGEDKAGSYAVQGLAALFIEQITGSYSGIMGLPIRETGMLLKQVKVSSE